MVLLDLMGVAFLEEAEICRSAQNRCASSWKDPSQPPAFLRVRPILLELQQRTTESVQRNSKHVVRTPFLKSLFPDRRMEYVKNLV